MNKKLTIITVNYNNLEGLKKTFESVVNQTINDFEYIIIDGGSKDGSAEFIKNKSNQLNYWVSESDQGIYNAMNKGIRAATGDYLLFLNSGDELFDNNVFQNCLPFFFDNFSFLSGNIVYFDGDTEITIKKHPELMTFKFLLSRVIAHQSTFIKRVIFSKYGLYNEDNKIVSDSEFFFKTIALNGESYKSLDITVSKFYFGGISGDINLGMQEKYKYLKKMLPYVYNNEEDTYIFNLFLLSNQRIKYLREIEKNTVIRKLTTLILKILYKIAKMF